VGLAEAHGLEQVRKDPVGILQNVVVPEADHSITFSRQEPGSRLVGGMLGGMLAAVHLNDELRFPT
jgi:hypothetical protein